MDEGVPLFFTIINRLNNLSLGINTYLLREVLSQDR
jgi:hypothetical protein